MNFAPKHPCRSPGCSALLEAGAGGYCAAHSRAQGARRRVHDQHRGSAASRGYDGRWREESRGFLARWPICPGVLIPTADWRPTLAMEFHDARVQLQEQGRLLYLDHPVVTAWLERFPIYRVERWDPERPATVVDHIIPHKGDPELFWGEWNWQPLTKRAHDRKTAREPKAERPNAEG